MSEPKLRVVKKSEDTIIKHTPDAESIPVAARSKAWVCCCWLAGIAGSNTAGAWMSVCCECCVLPGTGLCFGLITRPEVSYRMLCVAVSDREASTKGRPNGGGGGIRCTGRTGRPTSVTSISRWRCIWLRCPVFDGSHLPSFPTRFLVITITYIFIKWETADGGTVVKVLCQKSEGRWFDSRWCHSNFSLI
jgi:hypothetical protein